VANNRTIKLALNKLRTKHRNGERVELKFARSNSMTKLPCALCGALDRPASGLALNVPNEYGLNPVCDGCAQKHDPYLLILYRLGCKINSRARDPDPYFEGEILGIVEEYLMAEERLSLGLPPYIDWRYAHVGQECMLSWEDAAAEHFGLPKPDRRPWWLRTEPEPEPEPEPPGQQSALEIECICSWELAGVSITAAA
jgi:hypothetical protein